MSGHSKWANIKRKKEANDKVKASAFAKLSRQITLAVVEGGGMTNQDMNIKLRFAIEKAREGNMPKENIQRAIEKANRSTGSALQAVQYEAFATGGIALMIIGFTDNHNRTISEVRNVLDRHGAKLAGQGSTKYLLESEKLIRIPLASDQVEPLKQLMDALYELEDIEEVITNADIVYE